MAAWIMFLHAPRARFAETMSDEEQRIMGEHGGLMRGELRPYRISLLRGRD